MDAFVSGHVEPYALRTGFVYCRGMSEAQRKLVESQVHFQAGRISTAGAIIAELLRENPNWDEALNGMAMVQLASGNPAGALECATRAISARPESGGLRLTRGFAYLYLGRAAEGIADLRKAVELSPENPKAWLGLAKALASQKQVLEALEICKRLWSASERRSEVAPVYGNVVSMLFDPALHWPVLAEAVAVLGDDPEVLSAVSSAANASATATTEQILEFHRAYGRAIQRRRPGTGGTFSNTKDRDRPLRVGIVSSDFEDHSCVSFFMRPVFENMDQSRYEIYAYPSDAPEDATGNRLRKHAKHWRQLNRPTDEALAASVRADQIDIAIDLIGHSGRRRLGAFQPRCAPVQVTYLAYSNTTGMQSMDWRIVDSITDPPPRADGLATERLWRLDPCFVCYAPDDDLPTESSLPAFRNGFVTFGSMSELVKLNESMFRLWARVLGAVPGSRLLLKTRAVGSADVERHLRDRLERSGIARHRVMLRPRTRTYTEHLDAYGEVDIALDSWPYSGTTTVCESLVMGVPMLGLRPAPEHDRHAARVPLSLLAAAGLDELICADHDDLVAKAAGMAGNLSGLAWMRAGLRGRFLASPVCDAKAFVRRFERALRSIWHDYCDRPGPIS